MTEHVLALAPATLFRRRPLAGGWVPQEVAARAPERGVEAVPVRYPGTQAAGSRQRRRVLCAVAAQVPGRRDRRRRSVSAFPPVAAGLGKTAGTRAIAGGDGGGLVGEEHAIHGVAAVCERPQRRWTVQPTVDPCGATAAECAGCGGLVLPAVLTD